jgi:Kef-type K+ transport system membrane component KefB
MYIGGTLPFDEHCHYCGSTYWNGLQIFSTGLQLFSIVVFGSNRSFNFQPTVLGEIIAGIILGPSVLGQIPGNIPALLFPLDIRIFLNVCSQLGLIIFMFVVGLEVDVPGLARSSKAAVLIGGISVIVPFLIGGFVLAPFLYGRYKGATCITSVVNATSLPAETTCTDVSEIAFHLFIGVALSVTAFPVLARIIADYKMIRLPIGVLVMGCAALNDVVAWLLLTICLAIKQASSGGYSNVITMVCALIGYFLALSFVLHPILHLMVVRQFRLKGTIGPSTMAFVLINLLVASWFLHYLGFHAMLGAFMFGIAFPRSNDSGLFHLILEKLETVSVLLLLPCFFLITGLSIDLSKLGASGGLDLLYVCIVAVFGKMLGAGIPAFLLGMDLQKTSTIAVLMNTRGLAEIVILNIGLQQNILNRDLFTIMVVMAVVTTVMAGPLLLIVYPARLLEKHLLELDEEILRRDDGGKQTSDASILLALVHDTTQAYSVLTAGLDALGPTLQKSTSSDDGGGGKGRALAMRESRELAALVRPVQVVVLHFAERRGEIGTGLQETTTEVEQRHVLERAVGRLEQEGRVLPGGLVVLRLRDADGGNMVGETSNIARTLLPEMLVVDWPEDTDDQAALKHTILAAISPVLLYTGKPADPYATPRGSLDNGRSGEPAAGSPAAASAAAGAVDGAVETGKRKYRGPGSGLVRSATVTVGRLAQAIDEEFGGIRALACCARAPKAAVEEEAASDSGRDHPAEGGRSDARRRVERLRNGSDCPLDPAAPLPPVLGEAVLDESGMPTAMDAAPYSAGSNGGEGKGLVTVMIAGLGRPGVGQVASRASTSEVDHIFHALGVAGPSFRRTHSFTRGSVAGAAGHQGSRSRNTGRHFAPILISPKQGADGEAPQLLWGDPVPSPPSAESSSPPSVRPLAAAQGEHATMFSRRQPAASESPRTEGGGTGYLQGYG